MRACLGFFAFRFVRSGYFFDAQILPRSDDLMVRSWFDKVHTYTYSNTYTTTAALSHEDSLQCCLGLHWEGGVPSSLAPPSSLHSNCYINNNSSNWCWGHRPSCLLSQRQVHAPLAAAAAAAVRHGLLSLLSLWRLPRKRYVVGLRVIEYLSLRYLFDLRAQTSIQICTPPTIYTYTYAHKTNLFTGPKSRSSMEYSGPSHSLPCLHTRQSLEKSRWISPGAWRNQGLSDQEVEEGARLLPDEGAVGL